MNSILKLLLIIIFPILGYAEIDIEDQIRMAEDPNYLEYLKEKAREERQELETAESQRKLRIQEEEAEEKTRRAYVIWRDKQKPEDQTQAYLEYLRELKREEQEYNKLEKEHALYKRKQELIQIANQKRIYENNRSPAAHMNPRVKKINRRFSESSTVFKLKAEPN